MVAFAFAHRNLRAHKIVQRHHGEQLFSRRLGQHDGASGGFDQQLLRFASRIAGTLGQRTLQLQRPQLRERQFDFLTTDKASDALAVDNRKVTIRMLLDDLLKLGLTDIADDHRFEIRDRGNEHEIEHLITPGHLRTWQNLPCRRAPLPPPRLQTDRTAFAPRPQAPSFDGPSHAGDLPATRRSTVDARDLVALCDRAVRDFPRQ